MAVSPCGQASRWRAPTSIPMPCGRQHLNSCGALKSARWEFMVQRSAQLRILCIEDVDLGSGPLEWLCKGLRSHKAGEQHQKVGSKAVRK